MNAPASTPRDLPVPSTQSSRHVAAHQDNLVPACSARPVDCLSEAQYQDQPQSTAPGPGNKTPRARVSGNKAASGKSISHGSGSLARKKSRPGDQAWPTNYRELAAKLSTCLQKALSSIENATGGPPIEPRKVKHAFSGALNSSTSILLQLLDVRSQRHSRREEARVCSIGTDSHRAYLVSFARDRQKTSSHSQLPSKC
ncbi:hypothetical protein Purlil1_68 [Purpureocillium lilacinum]|uniref:Uncharacterized protein n=1 Tax=Purpureocillium lilacinum TaxID=33203 RepID=A0ABR0CFT8_PURLI|nr:hypothetical protein Purlil1_68 [Purpureocillium lilacinum]